MTYIHSTVLPNGDIKEIRTNPGAAPQVYINGVRQTMRDPTIKVDWRRWFAWYPVKLHGKYIWLKTVYRYRTNNDYVHHDEWPRYSYGTILDVLAT